MSDLLQNKAVKITVVLCAILTVITVLFSILMEMAFNATDSRLPKEEIFSLVQENEQLLLDDISANEFARTEELDGITAVTVNGDVVEYSCGTAGIGVSSIYCGFYYAPDDDMTSNSYAMGELSPSGDGFEYVQKNGGKRYYTQQICGHFYYYEAVC